MFQLNTSFFGQWRTGVGSNTSCLSTHYIIHCKARECIDSVFYAEASKLTRISLLRLRVEDGNWEYHVNIFMMSFHDIFLSSTCLSIEH